MCLASGRCVTQSMVTDVQRPALRRARYHSVLKYLLPYGLCPFFGIPPGMYRLHHVVMHHIENNVFDEDLSSTEPYRRDSFAHWLVYFARCAPLLLRTPTCVPPDRAPDRGGVVTGPLACGPRARARMRAADFHPAPRPQRPARSPAPCPQRARGTPRVPNRGAGTGWVCCCCRCTPYERGATRWPPRPPSARACGLA